MGHACCTCTKPPEGGNKSCTSLPPDEDLGVLASKGVSSVGGGGFGVRNFVATNPGKIEEFYEIQTKVGEGGFGMVQRALDRHTNAWRAVKTIQKRKAQASGNLVEEIEVMRQLDHPNIVRLLETFQDRRNVYLVMDLCDGGELFDRICNAGFFTEEAAARCVRQMLLAVNYLHQNMVIHRDLKPQNWLLATKEHVSKSPLKLIDFGLSKRFRPGAFFKTKVGTPSYVAPEVLSGSYSEKADIWSIGVVTYAMLSGELPFGGANTMDVLKEIIHCEVHVDHGAMKAITSEARDLVTALLEKDPAKRPSAVEVLQHKWLDLNFLRQASGVNDIKLEINSLKAFSRMHHLKKAAYTAVAMQLSDKRIENLKRIFISLDKNQDGTLSAQELRDGLAQGGVDLPPDVNELIGHTDTDGSGAVDYTEFLAATLDKKQCRQEHILWAAFKRFDFDGSGSIDIKELRRVLEDGAVQQAVPASQDKKSWVDSMFDKVDTNSDGLIDFDEFLEMIKANEDGCDADGH